MLSEELKKAVEIFTLELLKDDEVKRSPEMVRALAELLRVITTY